MEEKEKQKATGRLHFSQYIKHTTYILMDLDENALNITRHFNFYNARLDLIVTF